jgi:nitrogen fixation protein FixH
MDDRLAKLGWDVVVEGLNRLNSKHRSEVKVILHHSDGSSVTGQQVSIGLSRPGQHAPEGVPMREVSSGDYRASVELSESGVWVAEIRFSAEGKGIVLEHVVGEE